MEKTNGSETASGFPLTLASEGETVRILSVRRGRNIQERLLSMGIQVDDIIKVVHQQGHGSVLIAKGADRYAFGGGMAHKIQVIREA